MQIRPFQENDRDAVVAIWHQCGLTRPWNDPNRDISRKVAVQPELFFIGEAEQTVIATAMAGYDGHRGSVYYLAVSPEYQGRGFGRQLMHKVEEMLKAMGCPKLNIVVRSSNESVLEFYHHLGYAVEDVISLGKRLIYD
ncbi:MAG: GNAT family acetyltransferase [Kiritimatiellae bacterium]|nr:GNAT family acetyltransferase [Kiritimatiellia bacterium]